MLWEQLPLFGRHSVGSNQPCPTTDATKFPRSGSKRFAVLRLIVKGGKRGITDEELLGKVAIDLAKLHELRLELLEGGWIFDSTQRRSNALGEQAVVWRATPLALERWEAKNLR